MTIPVNKSNPQNSTALAKTPLVYSGYLQPTAIVGDQLARLRTFVPGDEATFQRFLQCVAQGSAGVYQLAQSESLRKKRGETSIHVPSYLSVCRQLATLGLFPGSEDAYILPYYSGKNKCYTSSVIISPAGLRKLAYRNKSVRKINTGVVFIDDIFDYDECEGRFKLVRGPTLEWTKENLVGAFAHMVTAHDGVLIHHLHFSPVAEIAYAKSFSKAPDGDAWARNWVGMCEKTALKRLLKKSPTFDDMMARATSEDTTGALPILPQGAADGDDYLDPQLEAETDGAA